MFHSRVGGECVHRGINNDRMVVADRMVNVHKVNVRKVNVRMVIDPMAIVRIVDGHKANVHAVIAPMVIVPTAIVRTEDGRKANDASMMTRGNRRHQMCWASLAKADVVAEAEEVRVAEGKGEMAKGDNGKVAEGKAVEVKVAEAKGSEARVESSPRSVMKMWDAARCTHRIC